MKAKFKIENVINQIKELYGDAEFMIAFIVRKDGIFLSGTEPVNDNINNSSKLKPKNLLKDSQDSDCDDSWGSHIG